jgi:hypothetical protein
MANLDPIPRSVIAFARTHVRHAPCARLLLLLHNAPGGGTSLTTVARTIDVPLERLRELAMALADAGFVRIINNDRVELAPLSIERRLAIADLATWYARDREGVLALLAD